MNGAIDVRGLRRSYDLAVAAFDRGPAVDSHPEWGALVRAVEAAWCELESVIREDERRRLAARVPLATSDVRE